MVCLGELNWSKQEGMLVQASCSTADAVQKQTPSNVYLLTTAAACSPSPKSQIEILLSIAIK